MTNNRTIQLPPIDVTEVPMFLSAFRLAACTAMMCSHPNARKRFDEFVAILEKVAPPFWKMLRSEEDMQDIGLALLDCKTWCVYIKERYKSSYRYDGWLAKGTITVKIDDKEWAFTETYSDRFTENSIQFKQIAEFIEQIAPIESTRIIEKYGIEHETNT